MEVSAKEMSSVAVTVSRSTTKLQRYPLRSATKSKEVKQPLGDSSNTSAPRSRGRTAANVSKSVGLLDVSGKSSKEKSAKPPRRLSIPSKSSATPAPKSLGSITPISEAKSAKSRANLGRSGTPRPEASKPSSLVRKFNSLTSASYWHSLIKLSESAAKHSVSLGFFKLALEFGCEPLQLLRDEFKIYVRNHNLAEFGDTVKELCEGYNISENTEQLQVSETCSHVPEEEIRASDDDVRSSSSLGGSEKLRGSPEVEQTIDKNKETTKKNGSMARVRRSVTKAADSKSAVGSAARKPQSKPQKPRKQEPKDYKQKKGAKESADAKGSLNSPEKELQENKENVDAVQTEEISLSDV